VLRNLSAMALSMISDTSLSTFRFSFPFKAYRGRKLAATLRWLYSLYTKRLTCQYDGGLSSLSALAIRFNQGSKIFACLPFDSHYDQAGYVAVFDPCFLSSASGNSVRSASLRSLIFLFYIGFACSLPINIRFLCKVGPQFHRPTLSQMCLLQCL